MSTTALFLSSLLERFPNSRMLEVAKNMPPTLQEILLQSLPEALLPPDQFFLGYTKIAKLLHPSWQKELIDTMPQIVQPALLALVEEKKASSFSPFELFLLDYAVCHSSLHVSELIAPLVSSEASWLAELSEDELKETVRFLSLFSLIEPFLRIVDKTRLRKISFFLSEAQKKFLSYLLLTSRPGPFAPVDMKALLQAETIETAQSLLLERGMDLLAEALYGEKEALIWRICYKIEKSLGSKLYDACQKERQKSKAASHALEIVHAFMKGQK